MPIALSSLQNDRIMHTKCYGLLTDDDLITFYRDFFHAGLHEKFFCELIDGARITTFAISDKSQLQMKDLVGGFFQNLMEDVEQLSTGCPDLSEVTARYPKILTNTFCNPKVAALLNLSENKRVAHPPDRPDVVLKVLKFFLEAQQTRKVAMYATKPEVLEVFEAWEQARRHLGYPIGVFSDISAASAWLLDAPAV